METRFDSNIMKLEKEIFDISSNINKFKHKNHKTMINMMEKIKSFSNNTKSKNNNTSNIENQKTSYESKKKMLIKAYKNISKTNISRASQDHNTGQF